MTIPENKKVRAANAARTFLPRRVSPRIGENKFYRFLPAACMSAKTLLRPQTCEPLARALQRPANHFEMLAFQSLQKKTDRKTGRSFCS